MSRISPKLTRILLVAGAVLVLLGIGGIYLARNYYYENLKPVSASQREVTVTIEQGSTVQQIGELLQEKGVIRNAQVFSQYVRNKGAQEQLKAGTYALRPSYSVEEVVTVLTHGAVRKDLFTILPGQRIDQIKQSLLDAGYTKEEVAQALDPAQYADHPALVDKPGKANLEGYLYPESLQKTAETSATTIIGQSLDQIHKVLTPELRAQITRQGLTVHEGIVLASMVEQEVSRPEDRQKVAQVFLARLDRGMKLQSDVTGFYGAIIDSQPPSVDYESPYNTYFIDALPVGPISNVSTSSLQAVARPANTDYLYFVAGDNGNTYFSKTQAEHEALVEKYCIKLCGR